MPKINQEEYDVLKGLDDKWKWIARNDNGALITYTDKPTKNPNLYWDSFGERMDDRLFQFIQWEDKEPYNIQELIEEYLYDNQPKLFIDGQKQSFEFIEESEETEVKKDIEWLKEETSAVLREVFNNHALDYVKYIEVKRQLERLFAQLDEPEVLSQEWIDEHKETIFDLDEDFETEFIKADDLQNLLVPKQELPVIPKFVAEWIESRDYYNVYKVLQDLSAPGSPHASKDVRNWIFRNQENVEKFVRAWLDGYEVEKEQKYYAKIKGHENIYSDICFWIYDTEIEELLIDNAEIYPDVTAEYMIKATKDEWANLGINEDNADFVKVEEMEE